jgi:TRAP-type C4-dicarboxylate transport system permease small subunit
MQMTNLSQALDLPVRRIAFVGCAGLILISVLTVLDVLLRWLFGMPIDGVDDLTQLALAVIISAAFPAGLLQGHNITIRFLGKGLGQRASYWLEAFGSLLSLIFFVLLFWQFVVLVIEHKTTNYTTMTAQFITWPWWAVATVLVFTCLPVQVIVLLGDVRRAVTGGGPGGTIDQADYSVLGAFDGEEGGAPDWRSGA